MMKYICSACERIVTPCSTTVRDEQVSLECPKCGNLEKLNIEPQNSKTSQHSEKIKNEGVQQNVKSKNAERCPKCGFEKNRSEACPNCGLIYEKWADKNQSDAPEHLAFLWENLQKNWTDDLSHQNFIKASLDSGSLAFAAQCYRTQDDDIAKKQLEKLTTLGVQAMRFAEQPGRFNPKVARTIGWALFILLSLTLITLALMARS